MREKICKITKVEIIGYACKKQGTSEIWWMHTDRPGLNSVQHSYISLLDSLNTGPGSDLIFLSWPKTGSQHLIFMPIKERQTIVSEGEMNELVDWNDKNRIKCDSHKHSFQSEYESLFHM